MKSAKQLFTQLKNGKNVKLLYQTSGEELWTILLDYYEEQFRVRAYQFTGNDVFDESGYENESVTHYPTFDDMMKGLYEKYTSIEILKQL